MKTTLNDLTWTRIALCVAGTCLNLTALASAPSIQLTQVSSSYSYLGTESRADLAAVIAGSPVVSSGPLNEATLFAGDAGVDEGYYVGTGFVVTSCEAGPWSFRLGPDFGRGGAVFVDGVKMADATHDLWWDLNWNLTSQLLTVDNVVLAAGPHSVEVFGFEGCCSGKMSLEFQVADGGWQAVSIANLTPPDQDHDGYADCDDQCPNSNMSPTVVIGGCNSGVSNLLLPGGCTIADELAHCAAGVVNHGAFVSCVAQLTDALKAQGLITGAAKGAIQRCAAQSDIGK